LNSLVAPSFEEFLGRQAEQDLLRFITCGSVDDGKSTLIGRLLWEAQQLFDDQIEALQSDSNRYGTQGEKIDFALLVDGLAAEREQGITIDVAYRFFSTARRKFIVADTPGHEQFTRNMVTGASNADLAVLLVDAQQGLQTQTRRHAFLVSLMGIKHVVLAVNKMDLIGFDEGRFRDIVKSLSSFAQSLELQSSLAVPVSALNGDNITTASTNTPWYAGPSLIEYLETVKVGSSSGSVHLRTIGASHDGGGSMSKAHPQHTGPSAMTSPAQLERLGEHLRKLRLLKSGERLEALLQQAAANDVPYADFLEQVLSEEVAAKTSKNVAMRTAMARFPFVKPLETFDFSYQPSIDKKQVIDLSSCHFIEHGDNVIVLGPPGVGKTHMAVSLGLKAIKAGYRVLFTTAAHLIGSLTKAMAEGKLDDKLKFYTTPRLLIIDEIGYLPIDRQGANLFFQLISRRYERGPMILTSNQSFGAWGEVFGDRVIATAILDRLLHHAVTLNIRGNSYRLKEKLKAGLLRPADNTDPQPGGEI